MKVQPQKPNIAFRGGFEIASQGLRALSTSQAWGATAVDLGAMVIPRTVVDMGRGPEAGLETARREGSGTLNHAMVGVYGLGAAYLLSQGFNKKFGVRGDKIFANNDTVNVLGKMWHRQVQNSTVEDKLDGFLKEIAKNIQGFNTDANKNGWNYLDKQAQGQFVDIMKAEIKNSSLNSIDKSKKKLINAIVNSSIGAESSFRLAIEENGDKKIATGSIGSFVDDTYSMSKSFLSEKVDGIFKGSKNFGDNTFIKALKGLNTKTCLLGLGVATGLGMCVQPLNMYLTRIKTGKDGFVGVEGREADKSNKFKVLKGLVGGAFALFVLRTIGKGKEIVTNLQFQGLTPTIKQFKLVYGLTIMSRFFSARDKNELRECTIKDTLGFVNWIILGNFVSKLAAKGLEKASKFDDKNLLNYAAPEGKGKSFFNWLLKSELKTRDEVLHTAFKKLGISTIKDGKALSFGELLKLIPDNAKYLKTKIRYLNIAQLAGYAYSGIVLGFGIPKLNIAITNSIEAKRKAKKEQMMYSRNNINFLSNHVPKFN